MTELQRVNLHYIHEHINGIHPGRKLPHGIYYDHLTCEFFTYSNLPEFERVYYLYQYQFGGFAKFNDEWFIQVGYGYTGERVIVERQDGLKFHVILGTKVHEDHESEYYNFTFIKKEIVSITTHNV
jgi:hypothetical protein